MKLSKLIEGLDILKIEGDVDKEISRIVYDSRRAVPGSLFVCIDGFKTDGHKYIQSAMDNGAVAFLVQKDVPVLENMTVIKVPDTRYALAHVSAAFFEHPSEHFTLIGVTGTKGKTTVTYMIKSILEQAGQTVGLIGTVANIIGSERIPAQRTTPESLDLQEMFSNMKEKGADAVVMEVSSQGLKLNRVGAITFDVGVFTNLSEDHIGGNEHPDMEDYLKSKIKLFSMSKRGLINIDSEYAGRVLAESRCPCMTFGIENKADVYAEDIVTHADSVEFTVKTPWFGGRVKVSVPGRFTVYNALAAIGVAGMLGMGFEHAVNGLKNIHIPGRAEIVPTPGKPYTVMIDYAHTPDSLRNILSTVKEFVPNRLISVFGCGGDRDRGKRPQMGKISGKIADFTIITSDNPRTEDPMAIIRDIEEGIKQTDGQYIIIEDRTEAIRYAMSIAKEGDIIVLAGKGHETYQIFKDKTIHYDEREIVKEILESME
ncbi:UDP-N-acetylmuramoyl-L-alanyl-D-glutamate--2,6-diaminopimelate ligase MurE [Thermoclostridium stercorarium subsp. stercorarium DSM 8532]|jgi:UDP-N-acetylmuramoyl-L-alanyl-D-glutamate--2,6-diaminopimelate ligase|uniref:UDP-N-acetylmuramoyl-L-alanyl-D-glutamate--2,6-diaminopimelate ligase n=1 Tax=Thermoclostridium stercorarium (strain ATCC 35414 / DSM 8532 / NCIMB 11754) TaxID=1121335 RepID=L7VS35_THES1|nr:UDP-N-acetylmuramoyl-L-alanyl-D-glutamate--2,6-diaminopimelate ligase [Thermoclostridium stercorarium]AGC69146.1 UDP-N-acetylmuramoyl-L-alanyl-D-glutamate--2,6-diaminopimelate ligase MurE [Thermoclostridium stercorarium subsp. stercorarium DSM 8532]AGI40115.1 UDP-N-acetylmuramoylalanyl-D-glutamate-2,6-diaminopimelate ligase [Thermoclostridium stercorarium subsp. stercorarium DSM 8532]UZQ85115.1 UDP-N-acetylmuramoyl-L-alanyl-D-glutamate--2,6-diaminopimelate ligase [Thermoclostridium stercorari